MYFCVRKTLDAKIVKEQNDAHDWGSHISGGEGVS